MNKLGIIIPSEFEAKYLKHKDKVFVSGMGKLNACTAVHKLAKKHKMIFMTGCCAAMNGYDNIGDVVQISKVIQGDYDTNAIGLKSPPIELYGYNVNPAYLRTCYSQDRFLTSNPYPRNYLEAAITDMESYAVVYTCEKLRKECKIIKVVSDIVGRKSAINFIESCRKFAPKIDKLIEFAIEEWG